MDISPLGIAITVAITIITLTSCGPAAEEDAGVSSQSSGRYLYVATGACYSGNGITTFTNATAANQVYRIDLSSGEKTLIADYYRSPSNAGDSPVSVTDYDANHILVLIENTTTASLRRVELVEKTANGGRATYTNNTTALSAQLRKMKKLTDDYLLISKSTAVEKQKDGSNRLTIGANAWLTLTAPASSCTTSSTIISAVEQLTSGLLVFAHAGAAQARIGVVSALGYTAATDCKSAQLAPNVNAFPTAMFYDKANSKLIVSYGGSSTGTDLNSIYAYTINDTTGAITSPQKIYDSALFGSTYNYLLFGPSAMAYDSVNKKVYVATTISTATTAVNYRINEFSYNPAVIGTSNSTVLTRTSNAFYDYGYDTKCISDMMVGN